MLQTRRDTAQEYPITSSIVSTMPKYTDEERIEKIKYAKELLNQKNALLVAHYYTDENLQQIADETGGCVADSLEMAKYGTQQKASTLVVAGVRFMGETAKILNPEKKILMPTTEAECSLDINCPADEFRHFCDEHPDHEVVVYANTSAEVKARSHWVVTSSIAVKVVAHLMDQGKKILWAPDKHLGHFIQRVTGAEMLIWNGSCIVHDEFKARALGKTIEEHPDAAVLVHPESPAEVIDAADVVGSTTMLIKAVKELPNKKFIVATDKGIFYKMSQAAPEKILIEAPTEGEGATCKSCAHCPWMQMNGLHNLIDTLENEKNEIHVEENVRKKALKATQKMIDFNM